MMLDTTHGTDSYFYHDTLSVMTDNDAKEQISEKGYIMWWLVPLKGYNARKIFYGRHVGTPLTSYS